MNVIQALWKNLDLIWYSLMPVLVLFPIMLILFAIAGVTSPLSLKLWRSRWRSRYLRKNVSPEKCTARFTGDRIPYFVTVEIGKGDGVVTRTGSVGWTDLRKPKDLLEIEGQFYQDPDEDSFAVFADNAGHISLIDLIPTDPTYSEVTIAE